MIEKIGAIIVMVAIVVAVIAIVSLAIYVNQIYGIPYCHDHFNNGSHICHDMPANMNMSDMG